MSNALFNNIKTDYLKAYKWAAKKQGKPGIKVWKQGKDDRALGLLIKYMREYYKQQNKSLNTEETHKQCRIWLKKAFITAPEWLRKDGELSVMVSRFEVIMDSPDPDSEAWRVTQLQKQKRDKYNYNPQKHELEPGIKAGDSTQLSSIIKSIAGNTE